MLKAWFYSPCWNFKHMFTLNRFPISCSVPTSFLPSPLNYKIKKDTSVDEKVMMNACKDNM